MAKKSSKLDAVIHAGNLMSDVCFNMQRQGDALRLSPAEVGRMHDLFSQWDRAVVALRRSMARKLKGG